MATADLSDLADPTDVSLFNYLAKREPIANKGIGASLDEEKPCPISSRRSNR
jgi:hypothetical protein